MVTFPLCKINLGLNIAAKRADGYHDLVTCFYPLPWSDILEIISSNDITFSHSGISIPGNAADNLCLKAYHLLKKDFDIPAVHIHLHKIIPTGAGLGGGSSDAAWTLRMLNSMFELKLSFSQLQSYASRIGSDCAFFIQDKPMIGKGRGEVLEETTVSLKNKFIVLVKPDVHVSTAEAYSNVKPEIPETDLRQILSQSPVHQWKNLLKNDFEDSVFQKFPVIGKIKKTLYEEGALYASMSGSGSSVFGIFESPVDLKAKFSGMEQVSCTLEE
jgi:4-diphosphocytidyl-2-C-methyl-D-erythritol kinase